MKTWIMGFALGLTFGLNTSGYAGNAELTPSQVLRGIVDESRFLLSAIFTAERQRPLSLGDIQTVTPGLPQLRTRLADLYRLSLEGNSPGEYVTFVRWPQLFQQYANDLLSKWDNGADSESLQDAFYSLHLGYARSIVAAYSVVELEKRRYVMLTDPADTAQARWVTRNLIQEIHNTAQRSMRWMHTMRFDPRFKAMVADSPYNPGAWENNWAGNFFYDAKPTFQPYSAWNTAYPLEQFLKAWEVARPGFPDVGGIAPLPTTPTPVTPNPVTPTPVTPVPRPTDQETRDRVLRVVERLYALLEKPEIASSDEMRRLLEELIDQLKNTIH